jgi:hypothetical protein
MLVIGIILMQALLLTQVDFSLAVTPGAGGTVALHYHQSLDPTFVFLHSQAGNPAAQACIMLALAPHLPAQGLHAIVSGPDSSGGRTGRLFATLIKRIAHTFFYSNRRVLLDSIPQRANLWAHTIEAIGPPRLMRPHMARAKTPNC